MPTIPPHPTWTPDKLLYYKLRKADRPLLLFFNGKISSWSERNAYIEITSVIVAESYVRMIVDGKLIECDKEGKEL